MSFAMHAIASRVGRTVDIHLEPTMSSEHPALDLSDVTVEQIKAIRDSKRKELREAMEVETNYKHGYCHLVGTNEAIQSVQGWRNGGFWRFMGGAATILATGCAIGLVANGGSVDYGELHVEINPPG